MHSLIPLGSLAAGLAFLAAGPCLPGSGAAPLPVALSAKLSPDLLAAAPRGERGYVVQLRDATRGRRALRRAGARAVRAYASLPMAAVRADEAALRRLLGSPEVTRVSADLSVRRATEFAIPAISADFAQGTGASGQGVGIAVIDSGIQQHQDLAVSPSHPAGSRIVAGYDFLAGQAKATNNDGCGHGTLIAGIAAGNAYWSTRQQSSVKYTTRKFLGAAPRASLINLRVLDASGQGSVSNVIAALDWCIQNKSLYRIGVINLSMGHAPVESYRTDPLCVAVERAWQAGITVVCAAGNRGRVDPANQNSGAAYGTIDSPGNDPAVITVGATNDRGTASRADDGMASYSSRGPTRGDHVLKPDLVAPGNLIVGLRSPGSSLEDRAGGTNLVPLEYYWSQAPDGQLSRQYFVLSGSSLSTALVSGTVALMLERSPGLSPDTVKARLMLTARKRWRPDGQAPDLFARGAGLLNAYGALRSTFVARFPALSPVAQLTADGIRIDLAAGGAGTVWTNQALWGDEGYVPGPPANEPSTAPAEPPVENPSEALWGDAGYANVWMVNGSQALWGDEGFTPEPDTPTPGSGENSPPAVRPEQALWGDEGFGPEPPAGGDTPTDGTTGPGGPPPGENPPPPVSVDVFSSRALQGDR